jgi:quinol-cytochrome oxidoreductase complex cytochrome b subunit
MGLAILILLILPFLEKKEILSPEYKNISTSFFIFFIFILFILG